MKRYFNFSSENYHFTAVKYHSILHGHVCVMQHIKIKLKVFETPLGLQKIDVIFQKKKISHILLFYTHLLVLSV